MDLAPILAAWGSPLRELEWKPVGGGFSGALVFNGEDQFALKGLSPRFFGQDAYAEFGVLRDYQSDAREVLDLIPSVIRPSGHWPLRYDNGRYWQIDEWRPGVPLGESATVTDIQTACAALAKLHRVWSRHRREDIGLPAANRRLKLFSEYEQYAKSTEPWQQLRSWIQQIRLKLNPWLSRPVISQPCLCDVHREHILFTGSTVTGIIDFAAMKFDHPAVDLARYLGEFPHAISEGVAAYHSAGGRIEVTPDLVTLLAVSGDVGATVNWLLKLSRDQIPQPQQSAVRERLERIFRRLRDWNANGFFVSES
ncbi:hypothetical protein BH11PLA2_BH11PLA2_43050 [soil metagenome]